MLGGIASGADGTGEGTREAESSSASIGCSSNVSGGGVASASISSAGTGATSACWGNSSATEPGSGEGGRGTISGVTGLRFTASEETLRITDGFFVNVFVGIADRCAEDAVGFDNPPVRGAGFVEAEGFVCGGGAALLAFVDGPATAVD